MSHYDSLVIGGLERCRNLNCLRPLIGAEEMICDDCIRRENETWRDARRQEEIEDMEWAHYGETAWHKPTLRGYYRMPAEGSD
jgi:hypothetical protein